MKRSQGRGKREEMTQPSPDEEQARKLFAGPVTFLKSAPALKFLPDAEMPEVAFAGRSNVGKSSLLNALTGRKAIARTSVTPGRPRSRTSSIWANPPAAAGGPAGLRLCQGPAQGGRQLAAAGAAISCAGGWF